jgi:adenine-specific DNA methylase
MIKYIGSKRLLVDPIASLIAGLPEVRTVLDLFSGTARVGHALKQRGYRVTANDHTSYAYKLAQCYVQADKARWHAEAARVLDELSRLPPAPGYFTQTFCVDSRYFQPKNGARIDAMREALCAMRLHPELEAIALVSLMEAADRVDSTVGLQMAYLKRWAARARYLLVSFSDEGYLSEQDLREVLSARGPVEVLSVDFKRYVGAQIGIYNPSGEKIGKVSHLRNRELLFLVDCEGRGARPSRTGNAQPLAQQSVPWSSPPPRSTNAAPRRTPSA